MQESEVVNENEIEEQAEQPAEDAAGEPEADYEDEPAFNWVVFLLRVSALLTFGAMLITSVDLSRNQGAAWLPVMRLAILPFVGGVLILAAAELVDRRDE